MSSVITEEFFKIIIAVEREKNGQMNYSLVEAAVKTQLELEDLNKTEKDKLHNSFRKYKKLKDKHFKKHGYNYIATLGSSDIILQSSSYNTPKKRARSDDVEDVENSSTKYRKTFRELCPKMQKERTEEACAYLQNYINKKCPDLTMNNLLGYLLKRENQQPRKDIAKVGDQLFNDTFNLIDDFTDEDAIVFMHSLVLSKGSIQ